MLNSEVLSCFSGIIMSIRSFFLLVRNPSDTTGFAFSVDRTHLVNNTESADIFSLFINDKYKS